MSSATIKPRKYATRDELYELTPAEAEYTLGGSLVSSVEENAIRIVGPGFEPLRMEDVSETLCGRFRRWAQDQSKIVSPVWHQQWTKKTGQLLTNGYSGGELVARYLTSATEFDPTLPGCDREGETIPAPPYEDFD